MLRKHRNELFERLDGLCKEHEMDFDDFALSHSARENNFTIYFRDRLAKFTAEQLPFSEMYSIEYFPGFNEFTFRVNTSTLKDAFEKIPGWIIAIRQEFFTPDLWEEYAKSKSNNMLDTISDAPLSQEEQVKAAKALDNVKNYVLENGNQEKIAELRVHIDGQFEYLYNAITRVGEKEHGKIDFRNILVSTLFSLILTEIFSPASTNAAYQFVMQQIQSIFLDASQLLNNVPY